MAEAVGLAASILAILGAAISVSKVVHEAYTGFSEAPSQVKILKKDLQNLVNLASRISSLYTGADTIDPEVAAIFNSPSIKEALSQCNAEFQVLKNHFRNLDIRSGRKEVWKRLKIMIKENEILQAKERIEHHILALVAVESSLQLGILNVKIGQQSQAAISQAKQGVIDTVRANRTAIVLDLRVDLEDLQRTASVQANVGHISALDNKVSAFQADAISRLDGLESVAKHQLHESSLARGNSSKFLSTLQNSEAVDMREKKDIKIRELIRWISPLHFAANLDRLSSNTLPETGQWYLQSPFFIEFMATLESTIFWCTAKQAGYGKSTLASVVIKHLENMTNVSVHQSVLYAFIDKRDHGTLDEVSIVSSFVKQICSKLQSRAIDLPHSLVDFYSSQGYQNPSGLTYTESIKYFQVAGNLLTSNQIIIIMDGLDESPRASHLLEMLQDLTKVTMSPIVKILSFSRADFMIGQQLERNTHFHLNASMNTPDIEMYIDWLVRRRCQNLSDELQNEVMSSLKGKADGMFQYAKSQFELVETSYITEQEVLDALDSFAQDLDAVYQQTVEKIGKQGRPRQDLAWKVFLWVVSAKRPMTVDEISEALCVKPGTTEIKKGLKLLDPRKFIIGACCGFITINKSDQITTDHSTIQDFLLIQINSKSNLLGEYAVAEICLTYLLFEDFRQPLDAPNSGEESELSSLLDEHPLARYVAVFWAEHVRGHPETIYGDLLLEFASSSPAVASSLHIRNFCDELDAGLQFAVHKILPNRQVGRCVFNGYTTLHVFAAWGMETIRHTPMTRSELLVTTGTGNLPIHLAAAGAHWQVHELILQKMVDCHCVGVAKWQNEAGYTPLHIAAIAGRVETVLQLVHVTGKSLLTKQTTHSRTPLIHAAMKGHVEVATLLLQSGATIEQPGEDGGTAVTYSVCGDHLDVTQVLVGAGADIMLMDKHFISTLEYVTLYGSYEHFKFLYEYASRYGPIDSTYVNDSLCVAAFADEQDPRKVRDLLQMGADANWYHALNGYTALHYAIANPKGCRETLNVLLDSGANINLCTNDTFVYTPLHLALRREDLGFALDLVSKGAYVDETAEYGKLPPQSVLDGGGAGISVPEVPQLPIYASHERKFESPEESLGRKRQLTNSLISAKGGISLVRHRLGIPDDPNFMGKDGFTALYVAAENGHVAIVVELLKRGADSNAYQLYANETALHAAARNGHLTIVEKLHSSGAKLETLRNRGFTPLHLAAFYNRVGVVKWLLDHGVDPNVRTQANESGRCTNALHLAMHGFHSSQYGVDPHAVVLLLIQHGADISFSPGGTSLLDTAIQHSDKESIELLLSKGAKVDTINLSNDFTPLMSAIWTGSASIVQIILDAGRRAPKFSCMEKSQQSNSATLDSYEHNSIEEAIKAQQPTMLKKLLAIGAPLNKIMCLTRALKYSAPECIVEVLKLLLASGADPNAGEYEGPDGNHAALSRSLEYGYAEVVDLLLSAGATFEKKFTEAHDGNSPLQYAIKNLDFEMVCVLLGYGFGTLEETSSAYVPWSVLHYSVLNKRIDLVFLLLENGVLPNEKAYNYGKTLLSIAAKTGQLEMAILLLENGAQVNTEGCFGTTPLKEAIYNNHLIMAQWLIKNAADVNFSGTRERSFKTPVQVAISMGNQVALDLLLASGADLEVVNPLNGLTPLQYAISIKSRSMIDKLVDSLVVVGATISVKDVISTGQPEGVMKVVAGSAPFDAKGYIVEALLASASKKGHTDSQEVLGKHGLYLNVLGEDGHRLLHNACYHDESNSIELLVKSGADMALQNRDNMTPFFYALRANKTNAASKLVSLGVDWNSYELGSKFWTPFEYSIYVSKKRRFFGHD